MINDSDLSKYKELFSTNEFLSLREFIATKSQYQKHVTSFPVILILDQNGKIMHSWSLRFIHSLIPVRKKLPATPHSVYNRGIILAISRQIHLKASRSKQSEEPD